MSEVTKAEHEAMRRELRDLRDRVNAIGAKLVGRAMFEQEVWRARVGDGTLLYTLVDQRRAVYALENADIHTIEHAAERAPDELRAIDGVGPTTMRELEAAMAERGLSWPQESADLRVAV